MTTTKRKTPTIEVKNLPNLLRISEASKLLNVIPLTLRNWDNKGLLKAIRVGPRKDRRYRREDILKILKEGLK